MVNNLCFAQSTTIDSLKRVLKIAKIDTTKVNVYNNLANEFKNINPDSTAFYGEKAKILSKTNNFLLGQADAEMNIGNSNIILSNYEKALQNFNAAQKIYSEFLTSNKDNKKAKIGLARAFASAGVVNSEMNNYAESILNYQKALKIYLKIDDKKSISKIYNNIGIVYKSLKNNPKALEYLQKALHLQQQNGEQTVASTLTNIGNVYFEQNNLKQALSYYQKAEKLFSTTENPRGFGLLNNYFGDYYKKENNSNLAIEYYEKALKIYQEIENTFGSALVLYNLGQTNYDSNKFSNALPFASKSLLYAKEIGAIDQIIYSEKLLSDIYLKLNNPSESLYHYKQHIIFRDSLNNENNSKKFNEAEANFESDKKNTLLDEQQKRNNQLVWFAIIGGLLLLSLIFVIYNRMQVKKRLTLQKEVAEYEQKALHLQMNPHFVFNCLGSISSFIVQNGTDSAIKYLTKFSKLMRLTLEYSKNSLIPIDKEIEGLQNYLELEQLRFNQKFDFKITSNPNIEDDMALPPLLIQPFVENAILHGMVPKIGNGRIDINFDITENNLICTIIDDGIGLTKSKQLKENSVKAHQSMALEITKKRLEMMENSSNKSELKIEEIIKNNEVIGTKVILKLPIQYSVVS